LKEIRKTLKMTQDEFSAQFGVSKATYVRYELGEMMPKAQFLSLLAKKFHINLNWLLTGKGERSLDGNHLDISLINPKVFQDKRYLELLDLLNIPVVEEVLMAKLTAVKALLSSVIEEYHSQKEHVKEQAS
jgi:transcriptional regulator with XRE-family HTH domain